MKQSQQKVLKSACLIVSLLIIFCLALFVYQIIFPQSIEISSEQNQPNKQTKKQKIIDSILPSNLVGQDNSAKNILILGRPGPGYSGSNLTDTIIIAHLEPNPKKVVLVSLPRDLLVNLPSGYLTKINSLYQTAGIESLKEKISQITNLTIDNYLIINLVVAKEMIELIDGLNVYVPQDIHDPYFPGHNYTYQTFDLAAGWRYLDGDLALKYIRTRYTSPNGDFDRMTRQQQVLNLLKQKVLGLNLLWDFPTYLKMFDSLQNHIETDLGILELKNLWQFARAIQIDQINNLVIDKKETNLLIGGQVAFGNQMASVVYPKSGQDNYREIKEYINQFIQ